MQLSVLTNLQQLTIHNGRSFGGYAPLLGLRSLRLIHLDSWLGVPNDISQLTWLETLKISNALCISRPPEALAGLGQLHTRVWLDGDFYKHAADAVLPAGPWLGNLRRLAAPAHLLVNSLPLLEAALHLEHLAVTFKEPSQRWMDRQQRWEPPQRILHSVLQWPSLQRLSLGVPQSLQNGQLPAALFPLALQAQRQCPFLFIELGPNCSSTSEPWDAVFC